MASVKVNGGELIALDSARHHEHQRPFDLRGQRLVTSFHIGVTHKVSVPRVNAAKIRKTAGSESSYQVESSCRSVVHPNQTLRIMLPSFRCELESVYGVTSVTGQSEAATGLGVLRSRLGVLPSNATHLDHRKLTCVGHDDRH